MHRLPPRALARVARRQRRVRLRQPFVELVGQAGGQLVWVDHPLTLGRWVETYPLRMQSDLFEASNLENETQQRFVLQNSQLLRVSLGPDVLAVKGAMVAYQGHVQFLHEKSGSVGKMLKKMVTSEDMPLMRVTGQGEVFFASEAGYVYLLDLAGDGISVNGRNLLAFDAAMSWDINRVKGAGIMAGGLFNTTVTGQGTVALCTVGKPVVLDCSQPADVRRRAGRGRLVGQPGAAGDQLDEVLLGGPRRLR